MKADLADRLIAYEMEAVDERECLQLFADLVASGWTWDLQGRYGKTAATLIEHGWISTDGEVLRYPGGCPGVCDDYQRHYSRGPGECPGRGFRAARQ
jgi:hypothetical protein